MLIYTHTCTHASNTLRTPIQTVGTYTCKKALHVCGELTHIYAVDTNLQAKHILDKATHTHTGEMQPTLTLMSAHMLEGTA